MQFTFIENAIDIYTIEVEYYKKITLDPGSVKVTQNRLECAVSSPILAL